MLPNLPEIESNAVQHAVGNTRRALRWPALLNGQFVRWTEDETLIGEEMEMEMERESGARMTALTGLLFFVLFIASTFFEPTGLRFSSASPERVRDYYVERQQSIHTLLLLVGLAHGALVWFLAVLATHLRRTETGPGHISWLAFGSGLLAAGFYTVGTTLLAVPAEAPTEWDPATIRTLALAGSASLNLMVEMSTFWRGLLMGAVSILIFKNRALPIWLAWVGAALAIAAFVGSVGFVKSPISEFMVVLGFGSFVAFPFWVLLTSIALFIRMGRSTTVTPDRP